jgi:hypothetical protein
VTTASNCILAYPNRVDSTYYSVAFTEPSTGAWNPDLPLSNLRDPLLSNVARSDTDDTADTQFVVDLGAPRDIKVISIPSHNLSRTGSTWRARGYSDSGLSALVYDTGTLDVWPIVYPFGSLPFHHPSFWDGKIEPEVAAGGYPMPIVHVADVAQVAQYWKFEFDDTSNADGYVELSRLVLAPGWQPPVNMQYGAQLGWETDTTFETSLGGVRFHTRRDGRRVARFVLRNIPEDDAMVWPFEMMRELGVDGQVMFVFNPTDTAHLARRSFLATLRRLSPLEFVSFDNMQIAFELEEVL